MLTSANYQTVQRNVTSNFLRYFTLMRSCKTVLQNEVIPLLSLQEKNDIKNSRFNQNVLDKLTSLGKREYQKQADKTDEVLYCICMSIGTIIKEYEWGTTYISQTGMCQLAAKIAR